MSIKNTIVKMLTDKYIRKTENQGSDLFLHDSAVLRIELLKGTKRNERGGRDMPQFLPTHSNNMIKPNLT
jgi:hypothetical protein